MKMKKLKQKKKKVKEEKAAESSVETDIIMLKDEITRMRDRISENKLAIDRLLAKPKKFDPVVTATPIVSDKKTSVSRYDDVCKEIDKELKA